MHKYNVHKTVYFYTQEEGADIFFALQNVDINMLSIKKNYPESLNNMAEYEN